MIELKYFVLSPTSSDVNFRKASRYAMLAFADAMEKSDISLANDVRNWVDRLENKDDESGRVDE